MTDLPPDSDVRPGLHTIDCIGNVYIARSAVVVGDVTLDEGVNLWHHVVIRGDVAPIHVGRNVNIQDGSLLHCNHSVPLDIAEDVAIGHHAVVHCRSVGPRTLIATQATVLDDAEIGEDCLIASGALVPPRTIVPAGSVVMGVPGRVVREIRDEERTYIRRVRDVYLDLARRHADGEFLPFGTPG